MLSRFLTRFACYVAAAMFSVHSTAEASDQGELNASAREIVLADADAVKQLVITWSDPNEQRDVTRDVTFTAEPKDIVAVDAFGFVKPIRDGNAMVTAKFGESASFQINVKVANFANSRTLSFPNDIVPRLTRAGCNSGACHGTPKGQNNFRLSLLGFEPKSDYEFLTQESRGRRIVPAAPGRSLLLQKVSGDQAHRGGIRMPKDAEAYRLVHRWIADGMPYADANDPTVQRIEVFPAKRIVQRGQSQQLAVTAYFSDGITRDVTRVAEFKANQSAMCDVDEHGLVRAKDIIGTSSVMVRFQEHMSVFTATIPMGIPIEDLPEPRNFVDEHVFAKLRMLGLPPSGNCDDSVFIRRATLDLAGRLPTVQETSAFLNSKAVNKRSDLIDQLLDDPGYVDWFANKWSGILRNKAEGNLEQVARETYGFHDWIRESIRTNKPFDQFARELITARGKPSTNAAVSWYRAVSDPNERMADMAQVFLGVRIQCAQCHHHPYEKWTQDDYHGFAAFFSTIERKEVRKRPEDDILFHKRILASAKNPNTNQELKPTPLDGDPLTIAPSRDPRIDLADWMTDAANPFFAKVLVNRYWKHFFGRGLVEPEDDIRVTNPATHPKLLSDLAESFVHSGYDLKQLCRAICNSRAYQQSSIPNRYNTDDDQNFARFLPRRMPAEVMLDAINDVAGAKNSFNRQPVGVLAIALPDDSVNQESFLLRAFGRPQMDTACECERSNSADLSQSLTLLNSDTIHRILSTPSGRAIELSKAVDQKDVDKIANLYLHALSRQPNEHEVTTALAHLTKKREQSAADPKVLPLKQANAQAFEDIIWVVVNTKEFLFNH